MTTATNLQSLQQDLSTTKPSTHFTPIVHDNHTVPSTSTELTTETVQQLDSRITGLASQMTANQTKHKQQYNDIMTLLQQLTNTSTASQPTDDNSIRRGIQASDTGK